LGWDRKFESNTPFFTNYKERNAMTSWVLVP
jgi:hypothetical protein